MDVGIPGTGFRAWVIDVLLKFPLELLAWMLKPMTNDILENNYNWRRKRLEKDREIILETIRNSNAKYNNCLELFMNTGLLIADNDVPYYFLYKELLYVVRHKMDIVLKDNTTLTDLKEGIKPQGSEEFHHQVQEFIEEHGYENGRSKH